ncbi:MAG TPA: rhomboid family intramembrane serine protease [Saprospiraceae bacterium]|nr:rhomboid family intramembrane serine protease [Saprospiraceae bacterium]HQW56521.1 rhomboid family intramembrane serine protease [Saprospiraceae bacterium]
MLKLLDWPYREKRFNEWYRLLSSGFIHADWMHLIINMFVLYQFGQFVEQQYTEIFGPLGDYYYTLLLLLGVIVPNAIGYFKNKDNPGFRGLGASGAVSAVLFAYVIFNPWNKLYLYGVIPIYSVVAAILYIAYSFWADRRRRDHVNHMAHLTGGIFGFVFTLLLKPELWGYFIEQLRNFKL